MRIAQMAQAVQAHARREASIELGLGCRVDTRGGRRNRSRERGIIKWLADLTPVHASSIAQIP